MINDDNIITILFDFEKAVSLLFYFSSKESK